MTRHWAVGLATSFLWVAIAAGQASQKAAPKPASKRTAARVNVTGTWSSNLPGGPDLKLFQEGDLVWGQDHLSDGGVRGLWTDGRLMLVYTDSVVDRNNPGCGPRTVLVLKTKGTATHLEGTGFDLQSGQTQTKYLARNTPDPGADFAYPYNQELKRCGDLFTWELAFESDSDQMKGTDWPVLAKVSDLLKKEPALKIKVAGHTDSTGDAAHNQDLSLRRAETVKKALVEKYAADAARITTKGWGADQPLVDNGTDEGRAINRRVEILIAH